MFLFMRNVRVLFKNKKTTLFGGLIVFLTVEANLKKKTKKRIFWTLNVVNLNVDTTENPSAILIYDNEFVFPI